MADSVVQYIAATRIHQYDKDGNLVHIGTDGWGLAAKCIVTPDSDMAGYNIAIYTYITTNGANFKGGPVKLYGIFNDGTKELLKEYASGEYAIQDPSGCDLDDLKASETASNPNGKWIYGVTKHIDGTAGTNTLTVKLWIEHFTAGSPGYEDAGEDIDGDGVTGEGTITFTNSAGNTVRLGPWISTSGFENPKFMHIFESSENAVSIDLTSIPLETAPVISSLVNNNPKSSSATGVSAATDSISWKFTKTGGSDIVSTYIRYKKSADSTWSSWSNKGAVTSGSITGLSARTTYNIEVYAANGAGNSNTLSLTVRTKSNAPTLTLEAISISLEQITYKWSSNYDLSSLNYVKGTDSAVSITINSSDKKNGTFTVTKLSPNTSYTVKITGAESLDGVTNNVSKTASTLAKTTITPPTNITHNTGFVVTAARPSYPTSPTITTKVKLSFGDYSVSKDLVNGSNSITLTEAEWDKIYKLFGNQNKCTIAVEAVTTGVSSYTDSHTSTINLTGIQKTAHIGDSKKVPRRVQVWVGGPNGTVRRAVLWIGDSNKKPRRTI